MHDLTEKQLSATIFEVVKEINRGLWLADRRGGALGGIGVNLPTTVSIKARVTAFPGQVIVETISVSQAGEQRTNGTESGTQDQRGNTNTGQSGGNTNDTTNTYGEV